MSDASDVLVERLLAWGVDTVFGLPRDGINGVFEALRKQKKRIRFIRVRHEEAAAFIVAAWMYENWSCPSIGSKRALGSGGR
jgi:pyruvate dehydrogenase (quinone)/pyruvate oxidase